MSDHSSHHVMPLRTYLLVWGALLCLTFVTVQVSAFDFGSWNVYVAIAVATVKAGLVALYFMHLRYDKTFNLIVFASSLVFLGLFLVMTLLDSKARHLIPG